MQNIKHMKQQGFTLIELMIVIAIIGILAAIAIPQYNNYVIRSKISEAVQLAGGGKPIVEEIVLTTGKFPSAADASAVGFKTSGSYVASIALTPKAADSVDGNIVVTMGTGIATDVDGKAINLNRSTSGVWECTQGPATPGTVPTKYLPASCSGAAK